MLVLTLQCFISQKIYRKSRDFDREIVGNVKEIVLSLFSRIDFSREKHLFLKFQ